MQHLAKMSEAVDPHETPSGLLWYLHQASSAGAGAAGALASWFNDIINGQSEFSLKNMFLLVFIGATIGMVALNVAPMVGVGTDFAMPFACAAAAAHKYLFSVLNWFLQKFISK